MVGVSASVNLPLHRTVQRFSSGTGSPGWSRKKGRKTVVCVVWWCGVMLCSYLGCKSKSFAFAARYASNTWRSADLRVGALHQTKLYRVHTKFNSSGCSRKIHSLKRHNFAVVSPIIKCSEINWKHERKQSSNIAFKFSLLRDESCYRSSATSLHCKYGVSNCLRSIVNKKTLRIEKSRTVDIMIVEIRLGRSSEADAWLENYGR